MEKGLIVDFVSYVATVFMLTARGVSLLNEKKTEYQEWTLNNIIEEGS